LAFLAYSSKNGISIAQSRRRFQQTSPFRRLYYGQREEGRAIKPGTPVPLNAPTIPPAFGGGTRLPSYAVTQDGRRFLMTTLPQPANTTPVTVLLYWTPAR
jgi:hypothetical protein